MNTMYLFPILADAGAKVADKADGVVGVQVLDYLKYGTLGLAGIILLLAFFLYQQANGLASPELIRAAQDGVSTYMTVAKWLLIPCMGLQILGLFVGKDAVTTTAPKGVNATIRVQPLTQRDGALYGEAGVRVGRGDKAKRVPGLDDEQSIVVNENDSIVVDVQDITDHIRNLKKEAAPSVPALQPTLLK